MKKTVLLIWLVLGWSACAFAQVDTGRDLSKYADDKFSEDDKYQVETPYQTVVVRQPKSKKIKNVIFMIGDGMSMEAVTVGWTLNGGHLNLDNCPVAGYSRTYCADKLITDSCAGGTALSSGEKTKYGYIGQDVDGKPFFTLLHKAQSLGKKTGLVVTCRINDATPPTSCATARTATWRRRSPPSTWTAASISSSAAAASSGTSARTAGTSSTR